MCEWQSTKTCGWCVRYRRQSRQPKAQSQLSAIGKQHFSWLVWLSFIWLSTSMAASHVPFKGRLLGYKAGFWLLGFLLSRFCAFPVAFNIVGFRCLPPEHGAGETTATARALTRPHEHCDEAAHHPPPEQWSNTTRETLAGPQRTGRRQPIFCNAQVHPDPAAPGPVGVSN